MPSGTGIAPPRCHPPPDGGTLRHVNNSLPGPVSEGSVHGNGSRQPDNWLSALADPFVTVLSHGNGVIVHNFSASPNRLANEQLTRAPLGGGGGGLFRALPPLVFLRFLLNQCRYHHQTCSTLSPNNFTHCVNILKSRVL